MLRLIFLSLLTTSHLVASLVQPEDRIVFIGDSITGQGGRGSQSWVALIGQALREEDSENQQILVPLGGSGHKVGSWANVEKRSRDKDVYLDIKEYNVGEELDQPADIVVIMLGMNDVLATHLKPTPEGIEQWKEQYRGLIQAVRERATPRVFALATPTPCTEDPESPKNEVMEEMVAAMVSLAEEEDCIILPTRATAWEVLSMGREQRPDFHITGDQVHPNGVGHAMIAAGMLRGLGEEGAANRMIELAMDRGQVDPEEETLSYEWRVVDSEAVSQLTPLEVVLYHAVEEVEWEAPEGWVIQEIGDEGEDARRFSVLALLDREVNTLGVESGEQSLTLEIPAPWLIGTANLGWFGWKQGVYDPEVGRLPVDDALLSGEVFADGIPSVVLKDDKALEWRIFVGNVNYGGAGNPDIIDFAQLLYFTGGENGYGFRWIHSDRDRPVVLKVWQSGFAGMTYAEVRVNGDLVFQANPSKTKNEEYKTKLREGWNLVAFKANFAQWQWQLGIDLQGVDGDDLDDLVYSILPQE